MKWQSNRVKKVKYLKIGPVDLRSMGLIVLCACLVCVCINGGSLWTEVITASLLLHRPFISSYKPSGCHVISEFCPEEPLLTWPQVDAHFNVSALASVDEYAEI